MLFIHFKTVVAMINREDNLKETCIRKQLAIFFRIFSWNFYFIFPFSFNAKHIPTSIIALQIYTEIFKKNVNYSAKKLFKKN